MMMFPFQNINEECGVFGVFNCRKATELTYYGLHALQHRGQDACGIAATDGKEIYRYRGEGLVSGLFTEKILDDLHGLTAIGHVRYPTSGGGGIDNVQPFLFRHHTGDFSLAHNGNIVNSKALRLMLETKGSIFQSSSDTEILAHLMKMNNRTDLVQTILDSIAMIEGGFAFLILIKDKLYVCRDKNGLRPLSLGKLNGGWVVSSETCALDAVGAEFVRDIEPGELLEITKESMHQYFYAPKSELFHKVCAMEYIYFARPDSVIEDVNVHTFRKTCGKFLWDESSVEADMVIGVPDSSISAAIGFSERSGIPYEMGLIKNKYVARTFIQPSQALREKGVRMKLSPVKAIVKDKRVVLIDDSIVRGTTSKRIVNMLREAGAKEVHVRIASPMMKHPCFYGVDTSTYDELIAHHLDLEGIRQLIGADTLYFLSEEALYQAGQKDDMCLACFNGHYPTKLYH